MQDFRGLSVWHKAHSVTLETYRSTRQFPAEEKYGLTSQLRRGAASIPANIAEACGRGTDPDFGRFLTMAMGSASELDYHLLLARDLDLLSESVYRRLNAAVQEVKRMLNGLIQRLNTARN